jgi:signal transduction histidine kinase/FixJ family two-component response regulator
MRCPRITGFFISVLSLVCLSPSAGGFEKEFGPVALTVFPGRVIGSHSQTGVFAQDARGRLLVGSDSLLLHDGADWQGFGIPDSHDVFALACDADNRVWVGAYNEVGYFEESADGHRQFHSLRSRLPSVHQNLEFIWDCSLLGSSVFFVCQAKVLRWDGRSFSIWDFPTSSRLYPVRLGGETWFTHAETGLYRLTGNGPELQHPREALPKMAALGLQQDEAGLRLITRRGIFRAGDPHTVLSSPELEEFLQTRPLSCVQALPDGQLALGTLGGLAFITPEGRLLRTLTEAEGLPGNAIYNLFLDQESQLWIGFASGGVARLDPRFPAAVFRFTRETGGTGTKHLWEHDGRIFAATETSLLGLETRSDAEPRFTRRFPLPAHTNDLHPFNDGLLVTRFGGLEYVEPSGFRTLYEENSKGFRLLRPSRLQPGSYFCLVNRTIKRFAPGPDGKWTATELGELPGLANECQVDAFDHLWFNSAHSGIWHFDPAERRLTNLRLPGLSPDNPPPTRLNLLGNRIYIFSDQTAHSVEVQTMQIAPVPDFPRLSVLLSTPTADQSGLHVIFARTPPPDAGPDFGLGRLTLTPATRWTELAEPLLSAAGNPRSLLVTGRPEKEELWLGGDEGILRLRTDRLTAPTTPAAPWLQIATDHIAPTESNPRPPPEYSYAGRHFTLHAGTPEISHRPTLLFQSRLRPDNEAWSSPSPQHTYEFTGLRDGTHTFEIRVMNPAGLFSKPAAYTFRIAPPWYRHPLAYLVSTLLLVLGISRFIRLRESRLRARQVELATLVRIRTSDLIKAQAAKDDFLAGVSHELRNPMNGILGLIDILDDPSREEAIRGQFNELRSCATHLSVLLEDLFDISRLNSGDFVLNPQPFDLPGMIASLISLTTTESARTGRILECAISPVVPRYLLGDATRIRQILLNYVLNAFRYAQHGPITLTVWLDAREPGYAHLRFAVCDEGPGIPRAEQAKLFHRFERGTASEGTRVVGNGLGLALCLRLAEKMDGRVWVESDPGHGAAFFLSLRLPVVTDPSAVEMPVSGHASLVAPERHALVVDDEDYNRIALAGYLQALGFTVTTVATGEAALAAAWQREYCAVFLDVNLPGLSGPETARRLRAQHLPDAPHRLYIATTAYSGEAIRTACRKAGIDLFLTKPLTAASIRAALESCSLAPVPPPQSGPPANPAGDRLERLRRLAAFRGTSLAQEITRFLAELEEEVSALAAVLAERDAAAVRQAAHRLEGRFGFIQAEAELALVRNISRLAQAQDWAAAGSCAAQLRQQLPRFATRLQETAEP